MTDEYIHEKLMATKPERSDEEIDEEINEFLGNDEEGSGESMDDYLDRLERERGEL